MAAEQNNRIEFLSVNEAFRRNAFLLIDRMFEMTTENPEDTSELVDEILHSIFFLGTCHTPPFTPGQILDDDNEILLDLMADYPEPFKRYSSRLPRRSPFSCVLDMVVSLMGQENEENIRQKLKKIKDEMKTNLHNRKPLSSAVLCVSRVPEHSVRHYGVSMSTFWKPGGRILVAASCFSFWNEFVADAVMSYYPEKERREYFDGSFRFDPRVNCEAFDISLGQLKIPCRSCANMFGLTTTDINQQNYGNCAEAESLSKLLREEKARMRVKRSENWNEENRERVRQEVHKHLVDFLNDVKVFKWDNNYYTPQRARL